MRFLVISRVAYQTDWRNAVLKRTAAVLSCAADSRPFSVETEHRFHSEEAVSIADVQSGTAGAAPRVLTLRMGLFITYRRTGGLLALLTVAAVAFAATVLAVAAAATLLIVAVAGSAIAVLVRAVLPRARRHQTVPPATRWPQETIATLVNPTDSAADRELLRMDVTTDDARGPGATSGSRRRTRATFASRRQ